MAESLSQPSSCKFIYAAILVAVSTLLTACGGGDGDGVSQQPPQISNFTFIPTALYVDTIQPFQGSFDFTDPNGDLASATLEILSSTGTLLQTETIPISGVSGMKSGSIEGEVDGDTSTAGTFTVRVYVTDRAGLRSNTLTASIRITEFPWVARTPMPLPRDNFATVVYDGKIYVLGGGDMTILSYPHPVTATVQIYDPATDTWFVDFPMLYPATNHVAAVIGDMIYVAGGYTTSMFPVKTLQVREPGFGIWMRKADLPAERVESAAAAVGGLFYVFGGRDPASDTSTVFAYDPTLDQWTTRAPMPGARSRHRAVAIGDKSLVMGGYAGGSISGYADTVYEFDPVADAWTQRANMINPLLGFGLAAMGEQAYVAGGGNWNPALTEVAAFDPSTDRWAAKTAMPEALGWPQAESVNGKMYVFDGTHTYEYTPANDIY